MSTISHRSPTMEIMDSDIHGTNFSPTAIYNRFSEEMHSAKNSGNFFLKNLPKEEDFKNSSKGNMWKIWSFLINQCHSKKEVKRIRDNLRLQNIHKDQQPDNFFTTKKQKTKITLKLELTNISNEVLNKQKHKNHLINEKKKLFEEISRADNATRKKQDIHEDMHREFFLLKSYSNSIREKQAKCRYFDKVLHDYNITFFSWLTDEEKISFHDEGYDSLLQTETPIKNITEAIQSAEKNLIAAYVNNVDLEQKQEQCHKLYELIKSLAPYHSAQSVFQKILDHLKESMHMIEKATEEIDIKRDAKNLRFLYKKEGFNDISNQANILQTTQEILNERQVNLIEKFFEAERFQIKMFDTQSKMFELQSKMNFHLDEHFGNDKKLLETARQFMQSSIDIAAAQAAVEFLTKKKNAIYSQMQEQMHVHQLTETKLIQIRNFNRIKETKLNNIHSLMEKNIKIHERVTSLRKETLAFLEKVIINQGNELINSFRLLKNSVFTELKSLEKWPMNTVYYIPKTNLSMFLSSTLETSQEEACINLLTNYHFPVFQNTQTLLYLLLQMKSEKSKSSFFLMNSPCKENNFWRDQDMSSIKNSHKLLAKVNEFDSHQMQELLPKMSKTLTSAKENLKMCDSIKKLIDHWWEYPALTIPTNIVFENLPLEKWKHRWSAALAAKI